MGDINKCDMEGGLTTMELQVVEGTDLLKELERTQPGMVRKVETGEDGLQAVSGDIKEEVEKVGLKFSSHAGADKFEGWNC